MHSEEFERTHNQVLHMRLDMHAAQITREVGNATKVCLNHQLRSMVEVMLKKNSRRSAHARHERQAGTGATVVAQAKIYSIFATPAPSTHSLRRSTLSTVIVHMSLATG
jgi:hypothetical protein